MIMFYCLVGMLALAAWSLAAPTGDTTGDGKVDVFDALQTLQYAVGLIPHSPDNIAHYQAVADVAPLDQETGKPLGDGTVDVFDALTILRHAVNLDPWSGQGDVEKYFPNAIGNRWYFDVTGTDLSGNPVSDLATLTVTGTKTVLGQRASVFAEQMASAPAGTPSLESYYAKDYRGVTYVGNNDPADTLSPGFVPYPEVLFPVQVGRIWQSTTKGLDFGQDFDDDGKNETVDFTLLSDITGFEPLNVAAGTFPKTAKRVLTLSGTLHLSALGVTVPITSTETTWGAPGAGVVKRTTTTTAQIPGNGAITETSTLEARGYVVDGVRHGMGLPFTVVGNLSPVNGYIPVPKGRPSVASDGTNFLVASRKASGHDPWLATWVGTLVGPDGTVLRTFDITTSTTVPSPSTVDQSALAFDGATYLFVYEQDNNFAASGLHQSLTGVRISREGVPLDSSLSVAGPGSNTPALAFDGTNYLLVYSKSIMPGSYGQLYGVFISPATGQIVGTGEFPITSAPGYQSNPSVAFDGTNFLVVWDQGEWMPQQRGIYARRVGRDGSIISADDFPVSTAIPCCVEGHPAVASDGTNFLVAWQDYRLQQDNLHTRIFGMRISRDGQLLDGPPDTGGFPITTDRDVIAVSPTMTFAAGEYWAAWKLIPFRDSDGGIFGARILPGGMVKSPGSSGMRFSQPSASLLYPAITANPSGGLLVWFNDYVPNFPNEVGGVSLYPFGP